MQVLLEDIKRTLGAGHITLPGAEEEPLDIPQVIIGRAPGFELPDILRLDLGEPEREKEMPVLRSRVGLGVNGVGVEGTGMVGRAGQLA
jgi:hypothetical protein